VDIFDDKQVKARITKMRNIPPTLKSEFMPKLKAAIPAPAENDPTQIDIESIIRQLSSVKDKHQAQTVKTQIDGLLNAYKLREAAGKYVSKSTVEESLIRIGATFKAALLRMEADLPPALEGMEPAAMKEVIRGKVDEVLRMLDDEYHKVYGEPDS
jgi:flagellar biosynthesis/type III secretory pathway protein FliH